MSMLERDTVESLLGKTFNYLTLIEPTNTRKGSHRKWLCLCVCGKTTVGRQCVILRNEKKSCGCKRHRSHKPGFKGHEEIDGQYWASVRKNAVKKDKEFTITIFYVWELFIKQQRRCALSGDILTFSSPANRKRGVFSTASLDRIDSSKGYVPGNVWWVHKDINIGKRSLSVGDYIVMCRKVVRQADFNCIIYPIKYAETTRLAA